VRGAEAALYALRNTMRQASTRSGTKAPREADQNLRPTKSARFGGPGRFDPGWRSRRNAALRTSGAAFVCPGDYRDSKATTAIAGAVPTSRPIMRRPSQNAGLLTGAPGV